MPCSFFRWYKLLMKINHFLASFIWVHIPAGASGIMLAFELFVTELVFSLAVMLSVYCQNIGVLLCRGPPIAAEALSSVSQYTRKVSDHLSDSLSSAWRRTSSHSRDLGDRLQGFKL